LSVYRSPKALFAAKKCSVFSVVLVCCQLLIVVSSLYSSALRANPIANGEDSVAMVVELTADRSVAFVAEQILVTLLVGAPADGFSITGKDPTVDGDELIMLQRQQFEAPHRDRQYQFSRYTYAYFPERAGRYRLAPVTFSAVLPNRYAPLVAAGRTGNPEISGVSAALDFEIRQAADPATWFPAQTVRLSSRWSADAEGIVAGVPITRTIQIEVQGQQSAAIPPLQMTPPNHVRVYADRPLLNNSLSPNGLKASRVESAAYVFTAAGTVELEPLTVSWWDINRREWRQATLEAETIKVAQALAPSPRWYRQLQYLYLLIAALTIVCLILAVFCRALYRRLNNDAQRSDNRAASEKAAWRALIRSLKIGQGVRSCLLDWAQLAFPDQSVQRIDQLGSLDPALKIELERLENQYYSLHRAGESADYRKIGAILTTLRRRRKSLRASRAGLPALYKA